MTENDTILVMGGTGQVGTAVVGRLAEHGRTVRVAGRTGPFGVDHDNPAGYGPALDGVDSMFLALPDRPDAADVERRIYDAAVEAGVSKVVKLSAASAGWQPPLSFGVAHLAGERALQQTTMAWTVLRPTVFQETIAMFCDDAAKGRMVVPRCGDSVAFVAIDDVAAVATEALLGAELEGRILELTGPEALSFDQVAAAVGQVLGRRVRHITMPRMIARRVLPKVAGMPKWRAGQIVDLFAGLDAGLQATVTGEVEQVLGRSPSPLHARLGAILG